ncbi:glycosyltransferase involved in cell wall biosynthesis [Actinomadura coerulea]|uniref:Glycosyltransferase involved in cell wall biosynthesis n=1 Tax=Actinomadura coerulea TaxID=46159 RepID=A0A7X0KZ16_9ACTN|nr:glycosyltransferase [Actinomadura coerulea]MBB6396001.1 glycosyltransferase involved in cell wall biosynthesis [Actinomadura coerulea]GGQ30914.1 glycosyl transferase [Actinomadura coerulea]
MHRPLHIALVSASDLDGEHLQSVHVRDLARSLTRPLAADGEPNQVTVYTRRQDRSARGRVRLAPGAALVNLDAGPARPLSDDELLQHLRDFADGLRRRWSGSARPDIVHAHGWIGGLAACAVARELGIPFVQSYHGVAAVERQAGRQVHPHRDRLEKAIGRDADLVLAGHAEEATAVVRTGVPRPSVAVVPYGVDSEHFSQVGPAMPHGGRPRLVIVSEDLGADAETALRALVHVPDAELAVAGGPEREELEHDSAVHRLRLLAKELHVADRVIFLGRLPRKTLPKLLRTASLALCLAPHQPSPTAPLEAMACGVPVAATPVGGNADEVLDHITGIHVPAGRPVVIGRAVRQLLSEDTTLHGYSIAAGDRARSRYSLERIAAETLRAYLKVLPVPEPEPAAEEDGAERETGKAPALVG